MSVSSDGKMSILNMMFGKTSSNTLLPTCYLGLSTTDPATSFTEPTAQGSGYQRVLLGTYNNTSSQVMTYDSANQVMKNSVTIYFPEVLTSWGNIGWWGLFSGPSGGSPKITGAITGGAQSLAAGYVPLFREGNFVMEVT